MTLEPDFPYTRELEELRGSLRPEPVVAATAQLRALRAFERAHRQARAEGRARVPWLLYALSPVVVAQLLMAFERAISIYAP